MVRIQIMSDLHLDTEEISEFDIKPEAPYLALLGDIGNLTLWFKEDLLKFLERQLRKFKVNAKAILNKFSNDMAIKAMKPRNKNLGKFVLLDDSRYDIPTEKITILGGTLFTHPPLDKLDVIDKYYSKLLPVPDWGTEQHIKAHAATLDFFGRTCKAIEEQDPGRAVVILTHHCPTLDPNVIGPHYLPRYHESIYWGASEIGYHPPLAWGANVRLWAFGCTRYNCDHEDARTLRRLYSNQRGPFDSCDEFDPENFVDVMPFEDLPDCEFSEDEW
ncbi:hypothetical protein F5Y04DRAFT_286617 [Hypomontagnella monticulosa]|nr:hypothetical protein F5Y04DRAFT_286617 [Hypomontagnella monticulosa]